MNRRWELDALRGLMLVLMLLNHLPLKLSEAASQPLGFVSPAEGFVLLSAWLAGRVYVQRAQREGLPAMRRALLRRALTIYACHVALLSLLFLAVATVGVHWQRPALTVLAAWWLEQPRIALPAALALLYQPPLMDVLPLYVLFMLASAPVLSYALRQGWERVLIASAALWMLAQFGLGAALHALTLQPLGVPVPFHASGPFSPLAWQLLWVLGLWFGARSVSQPAPAALDLPRPVLQAALLLAVLCFVWRQAVGQTPFPGHAELNLLFSKWTIGPLRLLNLAALLVLALHYGPRLLAAAPRLRPPLLETLGRAALPVFCVHLPLVVATLAWIGSNPAEHSWAVELGVLLAAFSVLWGVARGFGTRKARRSRNISAAGAPVVLEAGRRK